VNGSDLEVEFDELRAAAAALDRLATAMAACHRAHEAEFGQPALVDAAFVFRTRWTHGLEVLHDDLVRAGAWLRDVADELQRADSEAAAQVCLGPR
jgi:hypothetical protein